MKNCELKLPLDIKLKTKTDFKLQGKFPFSELSVEKSRGGQKDDFRPLTYTLGEGRGQICHILTPASYESLTAPSDHRFPHFGYIHLGGGGGGGGGGL
jgi:hypothetical protein